MRLIRKLKNIPFHTVGVILFFLLHGYSEFTGLIPFFDLLVFFAAQLVIAALFFLFFYWRLRSITKAGLLTTIVLIIYLFYGAIADFLKKTPLLEPLSHYRYLLSAFLLGIVLLYFYCKRSATAFQKVTLYLNSVFIFFILYDIVVITLPANDHIPPEAQNHALLNAGQGNFEKKPDIYFILMDEYSGSKALSTYFNYDNSKFENFLREQGFFVASSPICNYTATASSMASILSMDYLKWLPSRKENAIDYARANKVISDNNVMQFLKQNGYTLYNYSIFDIGDQPSRFNTELFSFKIKLITSKTLVNRMKKDLIWDLLVKLGGKADWIGEKLQHTTKTGNEKIIRLTKALTEESVYPKFVYAHLMMPHAPFFYDSSGAAVNINIFNTAIDPDKYTRAYFQYLVYTNKVMAGLMNDLLEKTKKQAVIILMSDHGYRSFFVNGNYITPDNIFNAVFIPGNDYRQYYDSISNVNQFRVLFNTLFETKLPLLPDSCMANGGF